MFKTKAGFFPDNDHTVGAGEPPQKHKQNCWPVRSSKQCKSVPPEGTERTVSRQQNRRRKERKKGRTLFCISSLALCSKQLYYYWVERKWSHANWAKRRSRSRSCSLWRGDSDLLFFFSLHLTPFFFFFPPTTCLDGSLRISRRVYPSSLPVERFLLTRQPDTSVQHLGQPRHESAK